MSKKMGRLLDPYTGKMECKICGRNWWANLKGGGKYYRGSWQCPWGCKFETKENTAEEGVPEATADPALIENQEPAEVESPRSLS